MRAGTHSSVIDAAETLVARLDRVCRVSRGVIRANARSRSRTIKILPLKGGWRLTVVAKNAKQEFHLFDVSLGEISEILSAREFDSFEKIVPAADAAVPPPRAAS
ncbi:MAG TPA: hypothetical protein IAC75_04225 [Candidatus Spyradosoma merdigallinarum]|uniref:Uncharacterized protein n=1 Tax=Candidatus Spyradosoma merdigallinarum TaxID=2840950 RepID=A0A9D1NKR9_9BACT|nr:hypothetical protein [Candidatus Spyradosoma merdigallinarum]